jgi:predicted peptidase
LEFSFAHPEMFAALVPIAGFVDRVPMIENCKIATIPISFHGLVDDVVDVNYSIAIYKKLKPCNSAIELTILMMPAMIVGRVYDNREIYDWMFEQIKI